MAGYFRLLGALWCAGGCAATVWGQTAAPAGEPPAASGEKHHEGWLHKFHHGPGDGTPAPEFENVRRALDALTPEQRKRFQENFSRWANLTPDEKKALRDREAVRRKFIEDEVAAALHELGLNLDGPARERFAHRYSEERRKIEEQLRQEIAERRKPLVHELLAKLKTEFASTETSPATPSPAAPAPVQAPR